MLIPYGVDVPYNHRPVVNWLLVGAVLSVFILQNVYPAERIEPWILQGWDMQGIFGHIWLHSGIIHLIGNLIFLWVFGNAICSKVGNIAYLPIYLFFGIAAGAAHLVLDGSAALGASGAINGLIGMYIVFFPRNDINMFFCILLPIPPFLYFKTFAISGFWMILMWFAFDIWGAMSGSPGVGYYCHLGGIAAGFALAVGLLKSGLVKMEKDEQSLIDLIAEQRKFKNAKLEEKRQLAAIADAAQIRIARLSQEMQELSQSAEQGTDDDNATEEYIKFTCKCGMRIKVRTIHAGQKGKCPRCQKTVTVPNPE